MRAVFFLLLLANLALLAWNMGYLGPEPETVGEGSRMAQQIAPEKIRILSPQEAKKLAETPPAKPAPLACLEWGAFLAQDMERLQVVLAAMEPAPKYSVRRIDETAGWWVFIPPQPNKPAADKKGAELRQLGVDDFFVINDDGPNKLAISLGVFKTEESAKSYLDKLSKQGVKNARAARRETRVSKSILTFREVDDAFKARLADLRKEFSGQEVKECAAEDAKADSKSDAAAEGKSDAKSDAKSDGKKG